MTQVLLVRHAQSEWNASGRWQGWADPPLTEVGHAQARTAGERLAATAEPLQQAVSSDLDRARTTAQIIAGLAGTPELQRRGTVEEVPGLRELDVGAWSGHTRVEIAAKWPDELARWDAGELASAPGGEDRRHFDERVRAALTEVFSASRHERLLVVAHGGVVRSVGRWLGAPDVGGHHVAGFWLDVDGSRVAISGAVDLLDPVRDGAEAVPDDSAGAL